MARYLYNKGRIVCSPNYNILHFFGLQSVIASDHRRLRHAAHVDMRLECSESPSPLLNYLACIHP